jgi:hypothetical protein
MKASNLNAKSPQGNCSVARFEIHFHTVSHLFPHYFGTYNSSHHSALMDCSQLTVFGSERTSDSVLVSPSHERIASTLKTGSVHSTDCSLSKIGSATIAKRTIARVPTRMGSNIRRETVKSSTRKNRLRSQGTASCCHPMQRNPLTGNLMRCTVSFAPKAC